MLQVALRPAPVAGDDVGQRRRLALVGAFDGRHHVHAPVGAGQQHRLDEIVALDVAAERRLARQRRQAGRRGEGRRADDGVVAPVVALVAMPEGETGGDQRTVDVGGELRQVLQQRRRAGETRHGLDEAGALVALHGQHQTRQRRAGHDAVAVENDEVLIAAAEATHPVLDIAGLATAVLAAATVEDGDDVLQAMAQRAVRALLGGAFALIARVGQQEDVERCRAAHRFQFERDRLHRAGNARRILVINREKECRPRGQRRAGRRQIDRVGLLAAEQRNEAERRIERAERDPAEGDGRENKEEHLQRRCLLDSQHAIELVRKRRSENPGAREDGGAGHPIAAAAARL